jgi:hypothetical protein
MTDFYNTNKEKGEELKASKVKALSQEERILDLFHEDRRYFSHSPSEVRGFLKRRYMGVGPLTSIRRAMTNLTIKGKLVKTDKMVRGPYGKNEHLWKLKGE